MRSVFLGLSKKLPAYHKRRSFPSIIQDMCNLVAICVHLEELMTQTGFSPKQTAAVKKLALKSQGDFVRVTGQGYDFQALQQEYFAAYRELSHAIQKIRKCAFTAFPVRSPRRRGYRSNYRKDLRSRNQLPPKIDPPAPS